MLVQNLMQQPLFKNLTSPEILQLFRNLDIYTLRYSDNALIFTHERQAGNIGFILEGCVRIEKNDYYGNRMIYDTLEGWE